MTRSLSKRSRGCPQGDETLPWVQYHNTIGKFIAGAAVTATAHGAYYVIEQPLNSCLYDFPPVRMALQQTQAIRVVLALGDFGAASQKRVELRGTAPWLPHLRSAAAQLREAGVFSPQAQLVTHDLKSDGSVSVIGKKEIMSESSCYPVPFCEEVARLQGLLCEEWRLVKADRWPSSGSSTEAVGPSTKRPRI